MSQPTNSRYENSSQLQRTVSRPINESELTGGHTVLRERMVEQQIVVPKRVTREEVFERVVVVPEVRFVEDVVEDTIRVREKIVEMGKSEIHETFVEVPEISYYQTNVEFPATVHQERLKQVERVEVREEVIEVPRIVTVEKIVEVPEIEYQEIPVEKIVEITEYQDEIMIKEVPVDEYIEVPVHQDKLVEVLKDFNRMIPVPVEVISEWKFRMPVLKPRRRIQKLPIYAPRFIEVPIPSAYLSDAEFLEAKEIHTVMRRVASNPAPSLSEIEKLAEIAKDRQILVRNPEAEETSTEIETKLRRHLENNSESVSAMLQQ